ncbi:MAG: hypothetical protein OEM22_06865 [Acidimicrobiia bacterium]|nr:hypothetical protein [Acidimicrobiia bacterium]
MSWQRVAVALVAFAVIVGGAIIAIRGGEDCGPRDVLRIEGAAELEESADGMSVILASDEGFTVGALVWILRIGDTEFHHSRYPDFALTRIEFPIPDDALSRLRDGDGIGIRYGNPTPLPGSGFGAWAPVEGNMDRRDGFAVLRVLDDCTS